MRVFICEYVTSGGLRAEPLPEGLLPEAAMIRDTLIADIEELPGASVILAHDDRLLPPSEDSRPIAAGDDPIACWTALAAEADVVWPIAPETEGALGRLVEVFANAGARQVAATPEALQVASSKLQTTGRLVAAGIATVPTFPIDAVPDPLAGPLLTKPDRGAGENDVHVWTDRATLPDTLGLVVQPALEGQSVRLTVLARPDGVTLLTVDLLELVARAGALVLSAITVGGLHDADGALASLAQRVVAALPGLSGLIGIDVVLTAEGPLVSEIHARVTISYGGLHAALGVNPAAFLPQLIREGTPPRLPHLPPAKPVRIEMR